MIRIEYTGREIAVQDVFVGLAVEMTRKGLCQGEFPTRSECYNTSHPSVSPVDFRLI
jgi:hypothetical protein